MRPRARILLPPPLAGEGWEGARSPLGAPPRLWSQRERFDPVQAALHASERIRALPAPSFALKRGTSRTGHNAGGDDARTARERGYKPRPQEPHSLHVQVCLENTPFDERDSPNVTLIETAVKRKITIIETGILQATMAGLVPAIQVFPMGLLFLFKARNDVQYHAYKPPSPSILFRRAGLKRPPSEAAYTSNDSLRCSLPFGCCNSVGTRSCCCNLTCRYSVP